MSLDKNNIVILGKQVLKANKKAPIAFKFNDKEYTYESLNSTLRDEFNALASSYNAYRRNKNDIFEIMQEVIDEVLPKKVLDSYGEWAEVKQYGQGNKPSFVKKTGKKRAKQYITKVGLAGIYEVFKLDKETYDIETTAYGGAAQIGLEEFLDGVIDFADLLDILMEGLDDCVYVEIAKAMAAIEDQLPAANKATNTGFDETKFDALLNVARAYGTPVVYATLELATKIVPSANWISDEDKTAMRSQGYVGIYKGVKVIVMPQSFEDETNAVKVIDASKAYILPVTGNDKPVKIAFEGETIIDEFANADRSREIQAYKKFGVALLATNDMCVFTDSSLA
jgi:hypothetical protein